MSSLFLKNNFTYTDSNDLRPLQTRVGSSYDPNTRNTNRRTNYIQRGGTVGTVGTVGTGGDAGNYDSKREREREQEQSLEQEQILPAFGPNPGHSGLAPFCGTFYDQKFGGNPLEGIHIQPVLAIDSKARNHSKYPNPNYYDLQLKTTYKDVSKVELKFALIPNSGYVINKANNLFYFQDRKEQVNQCKYYQVEIPCGDWPAENAEGPSIASILEAELNNASRAYGHRKDCNVQSFVPYNACICNCSTSIAPCSPCSPSSSSSPSSSNSNPCGNCSNCKGPKGTNGPKGPKGPNGPKGSNVKSKNPLGLKKGSIKNMNSSCSTPEDTESLSESLCSQSTDTCTETSTSYSSSSSSSSSSPSGDQCDMPSKYSVTFCKYRRKFVIKQISGSGLFNIIFCGGLNKVGEQGTVTHPIMGVDRFLYPEVPVKEFEKSYITRSIGPVLGFSPRNLEGCLEYTSQGVINFDRDRYVILRIPGFERLQSNWDPLQGAFAIIAATRVANDFIFAKWDNDPYNTETYTKYFNPPLPNLSKIRIEFYNSCGEPFDFNGLDHLLLFDVSSLTQQTIFPIIPGSSDQC